MMHAALLGSLWLTVTLAPVQRPDPVPEAAPTDAATAPVAPAGPQIPTPPTLPEMPQDAAPPPSDNPTPSEQTPDAPPQDPVGVADTPPALAPPSPPDDASAGFLAGFDNEAPPPGYVKIRRPRWRGTGLFIGSGLMFGAAALFQAIDALVCEDCALGITERAILGVAMGLSAGGGVMRARADAYDDTALRRPSRDVRKLLITGATLTGVGAALGLVNEGMWWTCVFNNSGPYYLEPDPDSFSFATYDCRYGLTRGLLDLASASTTAGLGLLSYALTYRRDSKAYTRARVIGLRPTFRRDRWGLAIEGRF